MKPNRLLFALVCGLLLSGVAACRPAAPALEPAATPITPDATSEEALARLAAAAAALNALETVTQDQTTDITMAAVVMSQVQSCQYQLPFAETYCQVNTTLQTQARPLTTRHEVLKAAGQNWLRDGSRVQWQRVPAAHGTPVTLEKPYIVPTDQVLAARMAGEEMIEDTAVTLIEANLNGEILNNLLDEQFLAQFETDIMDLIVSAQIWVGTADQIPYRQLLTIRYTFRSDDIAVAIDTTTSGINQPVTIPDPLATN